MNSTLTIRLSEEQRTRLHDLAARLETSESELVRQMIEHGLAEEALGGRIGHLKGALAVSPEPIDGLSRAIRDRNWRT